MPAFDVLILKAPLLDVELQPVARVMPPPVFSLLSPAYMPTAPPDPLDPLPTAIKSEPPRPPKEDPDPMYKAPLLPLLAVPELKTKRPLTPLVPAFAVRILKAPLLVEELDPLTIPTAPPVLTLLSPE